MSKWVNNEKYKKFVKEKREEKEPEKNRGFFEKWENPKMGTQTDPAVYKGRLLPDKNGEFYKQYFYHFFQIGDKTYYIKCQKSKGNMDKFCPWCAVNQILWKGNDTDKRKASRYRRNERFVCNFFINDDPRDHSKPEDKKVNGTVKLYEFPPTIEAKIKKELTNDEQGYGSAIFDPENGNDLIISILAKKPDDKGKIWPDYSLTEFSRVSTPIAKNKKDIEKIMESVYDLNDYLKKLEIPLEECERLLKAELVWDDIRDDFIKHFNNDIRDDFIKHFNRNVKEVEGNSGQDDQDDQGYQDDQSPFETENDSSESRDDYKEDDSGEIDDSELMEELDKL